MKKGSGDTLAKATATSQPQNTQKGAPHEILYHADACPSRCFAKNLSKEQMNMTKNILHDLYHAWERPAIHTDEAKAVYRKIEAERRYFVQKMSLDDCQRFQVLENLFAESNDFEQANAFSHGFKLGAAIMCAVMKDDEEI